MESTLLKLQHSFSEGNISNIDSGLVLRDSVYMISAMLLVTNNDTQPVTVTVTISNTAQPIISTTLTATVPAGGLLNPGLGASTALIPYINPGPAIEGLNYSVTVNGPSNSTSSYAIYIGIK